MKVQCWYCKQDFAPQARDKELCVAWINPLRRKGANAPIVRHRFEIWAHGDCVKFPGQEGISLHLPDPEDIL